jgi:hypothetical protein
MLSMITRAEHDKDAGEVWRKTVEEVEQGLMIGPLSAHDLNRAFGFGHWRAMPRFGTWQKGKLRPIDDALRNSLNATMCMSETLVCGTADFPLHVARAFALRLGPHVPMALGTDDIASAYRMIPSAHPMYTAVCLSEPGSGRASFFVMPGHNFGLACAPLNFNRLPELSTFAARVLLAVPADHFYDDSVVVDLAHSIHSSQGCLGDLHALLGIPFAPAKHVPGSPTAPYLGVLTDFSRLPAEGVMSMRLKPSRREKLLEALDAAIESRQLRPASAASLAGKLMFAILSVFGKVGRAALHELRAHADSRLAASPSDSMYVGDELLKTLAFFRSLVSGLPSMSVPALPPVESPLLVWSDAAFSRGDKLVPVPVSGCEAGLGFVVYSPYTGSYVHSDFVVPPGLLAALFKPHEQYVGILECLAAAAVAFSVPHLLADRLVFHYVDNQGSLSNLVSGSSADPDSRSIVYASALQLASLRARVWYEWVESEANIADLPSRRDFSFVHALPGPCGLPRSSQWVPMHFPGPIEAAVYGPSSL